MFAEISIRLESSIANITDKIRFDVNISSMFI